MNYSLLLKDIEDDRNGIAIEECFQAHKRKRQVDKATE